jgi:hypothetical protein
MRFIFSIYNMSAPFADYKDIFGKPREGVHEARVFGLAAIDVLFTLIAALLLPGNKLRNFVLLVILGCILHALFGVDSELNRRIGQILN